MENDKTTKIEKQKIELSNLDKILFPKAKISKRQFIDYYEKISATMLPHIKNRLLVMHRFPDGISKKGFYQKDIADYFPSWLKTKKISIKEDGKREMIVPEKKADIVYLANQACIAFHIWLSSADKIKYPDKIVFDLDPPEDGDFGIVKFAAYKIRDIFEKKKIKTYVMTTGSKGLHIIIPIKPEHTFKKVRDFTKKTVSELAKKYPEKLTVEVRKNKRKGRIFLDYLRNAYGQTSVAPYSARAIEKAPIAAPLDWDELPGLDDPQKYNISNIFRRLSQKNDPWKDIYKHKQKIEL